jgi:hypothetical protein
VATSNAASDKLAKRYRSEVVPSMLAYVVLIFVSLRWLKTPVLMGCFGVVKCAVYYRA